MAQEHVDEFLGSGYSFLSFKAIRDSRTGIFYPDWGTFPAYNTWIRSLWSIVRACAAVGGGRVYHDDSDTAAQFSVTALTFLDKGEPKTMNAATAQSLSGGDGVYSIYAVPTSSSVQVSAVDGGWPSVPHVRIAQITLSSGEWNLTSGFEDFRHSMALRVVDERNGGKLQVEAHTSGDTLTASESQSVHTNESATGSVTLVLPSAASGLSFEFAVLAAQTLEIQAAAGDTIRVAGDVSGAAGTIDANTVGNAVRIVAVNATNWVAMSYVGTWNVT